MDLHIDLNLSFHGGKKKRCLSAFGNINESQLGEGNAFYKINYPRVFAFWSNKVHLNTYQRRCSKKYYGPLNTVYFLVNKIVHKHTYEDRERSTQNPKSLPFLYHERKVKAFLSE